MQYHHHASRPLSVVDDDSPKQYLNSVCATDSGAWIVSVTADEGDGHYVYTRRSTDRGQTWEARVPAYDASDLGSHYQCEMGQLLPTEGRPGGQRIYQFHIVRDTRLTNRFGRLVFSYSEDDGLSWTGLDGANSVIPVRTPEYELAPGGSGWHLMAPPRRLSNGEWVLPLNVSTDPPALADIRSEVVFAFSSAIDALDDPLDLEFEFHPAPPHGIAAPLKDHPGESLAQEPQLVEMGDHRLMVVMRTGNGYIAYSVSDDWGRTWGKAGALRNRVGDLMAHPNAACPFIRLSRGQHALLYCDNDGTAFGGRDVYDYKKVRQPIYVAIGREVGSWSPQPVQFGPPRLLCGLDGFRPEVDWRDLTYGQLLEVDGRVYHFYNAVWQSIQVNRVDPGLLRP